MTSRIKRLHEKKLLGNAPDWMHHTIQYEVMMGSVAYGVSQDTSDIDLYGWCIPPQRMVFPHTTGAIPGFGKKPENFETFQKHHMVMGTNQYDVQVYSIVRFFALAAENNPNMVDSLFVPDNCVLYSTELGQRVRAERRHFLHKGAFHRFKGYAYAQMKKMEDQTREGARKELFEAYGYDTKFAYHLVRLADECLQILETGDLDLQRNKAELAHVREGGWTLEQVKDWFARMEVQLQYLYDNSDLPHTYDFNHLNSLLRDCLEMHYGSIPQDVGDAAQVMIDKIRAIVQ